MINDFVFSVVIPTCNRRELLQLCLDAISPAQQKFHEKDYEVIVTNDGRGSVTEIQNKYPWVKFIAGPAKGPAANRNNGAKYAKGEWLIFLDDDCIPDRDLLNKYSEAIHKNKNTHVFEGKIYVKEPKYRLDIISPVNLSGGYLWACNFLIQRGLFLKLSGFDEGFPYAAMEDVDLKIRIEQTGHSIMFISGAAVCHPWRKKGGWKKVMQHNFSTFIFLKKHPEERARINSKYYLKLVARTFLFDTLPGIIRYKGRGFFTAIVEHLGYIKMAIQLLYTKSK